MSILVTGAARRARRAAGWAWRRTVRSELGEGVISAAIAVLIMAFLGVAMWFGFRQTLGNTQTNVNNQVTRIGTDNGAGGTGGGVGGTGAAGGTSRTPAGG